MEHESANDFIVNPPVENQELTFRAECVKYSEPFVRSKNHAIDWNLFNSLVSDGSLTPILSGDTDKINASLTKLIESTEGNNNG